MTKEISLETQELILKYSFQEIDKQELIKELDIISDRKRRSCIRKDGSFDYLKMSELYHSGKW